MEPTYPKVQRNLIDEPTARRFAEPSLPTWLLAVGFEWSMIAATLWLCAVRSEWWVWLAAIFFIGTRQHALGVLAHEGSHFLVCKSRYWNDLLGNCLTAYPLGLSIQGYRTTHLQHHWYLETPDDPSRVSVEKHTKDWTFPMSRAYFVRMLLKDVTGLSQKSEASLLRYLWDIPGGRASHLIRMFSVQALFIAFAAANGMLHAYFLLWLLPLFTVTVTIYHVRAIAEHSGLGEQEHRYRRNYVDPLTVTRTTTMGAVARFLFAPYNISYHIEHHLYPSVPVFKLRALHETLREKPAYAASAHVTPGHRALIQELTAS